MVDRSDWTGLVQNRAGSAEIKLVMPQQQGTAGGSGSFRGLADDGNRYWIKPPNNLQGDRVPVTEQIVGRAGALIGAPTCTVRTIEIAQDFETWEFRPGNKLKAGIGHASLLVPDAVETRSLDMYRTDDDNVRRHTAILALHDWCWGGDTQGLIEQTADNRFYSHDHGWYLPPEGPGWNSTELVQNVDVPHEIAVNRVGLSTHYAEEVAKALEQVQRSQLVTLLESIPASWPVTNEELDSVGFFLERRALAAAGRIRMGIGGAP